MTKTYDVARRLSVCAAAALATVAFAVAAPIEVRKNTVIPVRFDSQLSTGTSQRGDLFTASAEFDNIFPLGTKFDGHVVRVEHKTDRHPASMDLAFDDVRLADGSRQPIAGVPIPLTSKYVDRDRGGH